MHAISAVAQVGMTEVQRELAAIIRAEEARLGITAPAPAEDKGRHDRWEP